jgi:hypothetical protein
MAVPHDKAAQRGLSRLSGDYLAAQQTAAKAMALLLLQPLKNRGRKFVLLTYWF